VTERATSPATRMNGNGMEADLWSTTRAVPTIGDATDRAKCRHSGRIFGLSSDRAHLTPSHSTGQVDFRMSVQICALCAHGDT
jgi:hypothetical protein